MFKLIIYYIKLELFKLREFTYTIVLMELGLKNNFNKRK